MNIDFTKGNITLVIAPIDMRSGYKGLSLIAQEYLNIDVDSGGHWIVFISRSRDVSDL